MITTAVRLFQRDGYAATSWRGLTEEGGTPWGSVQHHFPGGKEELGVAALEAGSDAVSATITRAFEKHETAEDAVRWWFAKAAERLVRGDFRAGCTVATVALETANKSEALTLASRRAFRRWIDLLATALRAKGIPGSRAEELATTTLMSLEGALLVARVLRDTGPIELAASTIAELLQSS